MVDWIVEAVLQKSTRPERERTKSELACAWQNLKRQRPPGYIGDLPGDPALSDPRQAIDDETELAMLRTYVPKLERKIAAAREQLESTIIEPDAPDKEDVERVLQLFFTGDNAMINLATDGSSITVSTGGGNTIGSQSANGNGTTTSSQSVNSEKVDSDKSGFWIRLRKRGALVALFTVPGGLASIGALWIAADLQWPLW